MRSLTALAVLLGCGCAGTALRATIDAANIAAGADGWYQLSTVRLPEELRWSVELPGVVGDCEPVGTWLSAHDGLMVILVPGAKGMNDDWEPMLEALHHLPLKGLFELRWNTRADPDGYIAGVAVAVNRLLRCAPHPDQGVLVIGYGAGAVLSDAAAAWFAVPSNREGVAVGVLEVVPDGSTPLDALFPGDPAPPAPALGVEVTRVRATLAEAAAHLAQGDLPQWAKGAPP